MPTKPSRPQESPQEPRVPEVTQTPETPESGAKKVREAADQAQRKAQEKLDEEKNKYDNLLGAAEESTRGDFRKAIEQSGMEKKSAETFVGKNFKAYEVIREKEGPGAAELYNRETQKYIRSEDTWSVPKGVAKADAKGNIYLYKRGKNDKGEPTLYAMSPAGGYQQLDLTTGKWAILEPSGGQKKELADYENTAGLLRGVDTLGQDDTEQANLNRDVEEQVLKARSLTKEQYEAFKKKNPNAWKENKEEGARLDTFMEIQLRETELAAAKGRVDNQPKGPVAAAAATGAEIARGATERKEALEKSPEEMRDELNVEWAKVHALVKDSESIKGTPIGSLFADKERPFEVKAEDEYVHMRLEGDQKEALTSIGKNIGYRVEGDTLRRGRNEELDLKGTEITMDLHEWTGAAKPQSAAEKMAIFGRSMDLITMWEGRFATAPDSQLVLNFNNLEKQKDEGKWEEDAVAQKKLDDVVSKMPKDLVDPKTGRPCGRALDTAVMKKDSEGNLVIAFPAADKQIDDFKHFHQSWWTGAEQPSVKERVEKKEGEEAAKTVEFGIVVTDGGFTAMLRDIEIRMLGKDVKEEEKPKGDGVGGSSGEKTPEEKEEDAKDPENRVEKLGKTLEALLKDRGEAAKRVDELKPRKERLSKDLKEATDHLNGAKSEVTEAQNAVKKANEEVQKLEKSKVEGDKDLLPTKRRELEVRHKAESVSKELLNATEKHLEKLDEQYKKVGVELEASEKTIAEVSDKIKNLVDEELDKLGEGKSKEGGYTFEGENKYEYTLKGTTFTYEGGAKPMAVQELLEKVKTQAKIEKEKHDSIPKDGKWHAAKEVKQGKEGWEYLRNSESDLMYAKKGEQLQVYVKEDWPDAAKHVGIDTPEEAVKYRQTLAEQGFEDKWVKIKNGVTGYEYKIDKSGALIARFKKEKEYIYYSFDVAKEEWKGVSGKTVA